jgi:hypothetical protein
MPGHDQLKLFGNDSVCLYVKKISLTIIMCSVCIYISNISLLASKRVLWGVIRAGFWRVFGLFAGFVQILS